jgi:YidC/Oxa1 family membrane protein insertase
MGQQFYVIRNNPAPNTEAFRAKQRRDAEKARKHGRDPEQTDDAVEAVEPEKPVTPPRQQPKKQSRSQRKSNPGQKPSQKPTQKQAQKQAQKQKKPGQQPQKPTTEQGESA